MTESPNSWIPERVFQVENPRETRFMVHEVYGREGNRAYTVLNTELAAKSHISSVIKEMVLSTTVKDRRNLRSVEKLDSKHSEWTYSLEMKLYSREEQTASANY